MPLGPYDPGQELLKAYQAAKIDLAVMLSADGEDLRLTGQDLASLYRQAGMEIVKTAHRRFHHPGAGCAGRVLERIRRLPGGGQNVVVHCSAGVGRTGVLMACLAKPGPVSDSAAAIRWVRAAIPGAVETEPQRQF